MESTQTNLSNESIFESFAEMDELVHSFHRARFASGSFLCFCATITVIANLLLLWTIQKNTRKCFKTPTIYFIIGVCLTDLLTGLVVEPFFGVCYIADFQSCRQYLKAFQVLPPLLTNLSFFIVLLLSWVQYLAISHPHIYREKVTKRKVIFSEVIVLVYLTIFSLLPIMGVSSKTVQAIDAIFHSTFVPFLLLMSYILILTSVRRHARRRSVRFRQAGAETDHLPVKELELKEITKNRHRNARKLKRHSSILRYVERQFISFNLCLILSLLVCTLPTITVLHMTLNWKDVTAEQDLELQIARVIADDILFLKFALDPFIFAFSFRKLRKPIRFPAICNGTT